MFNDLIGHERQIAYFRRVLEQKTLAHAYVLIGADSVGKRALAERLVATWLGIEIKKLAMHPDVMAVTRPVDEKTGEKKRQISIEQVRAVCDRLALSAVGGRKVALIDEADSMTTQAQNALLKTLEEPSGQTLILLLAEDKSRLLPTILSRSVPVTLSRVATTQIEKGLIEQGFSVQIAREAATRAEGRPGKALKLADADVLMAARKQDVALKEFIAAPRYERIRTIATLVKGDDAKSADGREDWLIELCRVLHLELHTDPGNASKIIPGLSAILEAREALRENGNIALSLERIALALP